MELISVNELAKTCGTTYHTVNFYINIGLLRVVDRRGNKRYLKKRNAVTVMKKVMVLRKEGIPLQMIMKHIEGHIRINLN